MILNFFKNEKRKKIYSMWILKLKKNSKKQINNRPENFNGRILLINRSRYIICNEIKKNFVEA